MGQPRLGAVLALDASGNVAKKGEGNQAKRVGGTRVWKG